MAKVRPIPNMPIAGGSYTFDKIEKHNKVFFKEEKGGIGSVVHKREYGTVKTYTRYSPLWSSLKEGVVTNVFGTEVHILSKEAHKWYSNENIRIYRQEKCYYHCRYFGYQLCRMYREFRSLLEILGKNKTIRR